MPQGRLRIHDGKLLRRLMQHPGSAGNRHTVRSLAAATGLSYSKIQRLITEERPYVDLADANRIAEAVQVSRRALFTPTPSPFSNGDDDRRTPDGTEGPAGPRTSSPARGPQELGEHARPDEPDGEGESRGERPL